MDISDSSDGEWTDGYSSDSSEYDASVEDNGTGYWINDDF